MNVNIINIFIKIINNCIDIFKYSYYYNSNDINLKIKLLFIIGGGFYEKRSTR